MSVQTRKKNAGFTLVEAMVALGVLMIFAAGIYGGIRLVFQVVYQSRLRILESAIVTEQIEVIRNMSFFDVGIVNGSPAGLLTRNMTTTRNNIDFIITRTIRNIDDPFDGTIDAAPLTPPGGKVYVCHGGSTLSINYNAQSAHENHGDTVGPCDGDPEAGNIDHTPADYKFVEISVTCVSCRQREPLTASTLVGPKFLEGNEDNGALFLEVIDASGQPVPGATVAITASTTDPVYDFEDTTDNDGMVRIVDLVPSQNAYGITISKYGYTSDKTTTAVPNPIKPPASVVRQDVTARTFSIDVMSNITVETKNALCAPVGNANITLQGNKLIGTDPDTFAVSQSSVTNGAGEYITNVAWDTYTMIPTGYDLIGSIPMLPLEVLPGASTNVSLILGPNTAHSLLVHVEDSASGDPISSSTVQITRGSTQSAITGIGTIRQQNWSGGSGQVMYTDENSYATDNGNVEAGEDIVLTETGGSYSSSGWLESSTFDLGGPANFITLEWGPTSQPIAAGADSVRLQFATSNSSTPASWNFVGPGGTASTYYTPTDQSLSAVHADTAYARYRVYLQTASSTVTPTVSDISFTYVAACTPPGQAYFSALSSGVYTLEVNAGGYEGYLFDIDVSGDTRFIVPLVAN